MTTHASPQEGTLDSTAKGSFFDQPRAVWAVAFACVIAFMGIGLVDPILKEIAAQLDATPSQVSLLFTSYMAVMGVSMLVTGVISSRITLAAGTESASETVTNDPADGVGGRGGFGIANTSSDLTVDTEFPAKQRRRLVDGGVLGPVRADHVRRPVGRREQPGLDR